MITHAQFDELLSAHDDAVMAAILRKERNRPKEEYDEACVRVVNTANALWAAIASGSQDGELERLRRVEAAALRVASSRRDGIVTDKAPLDALDAALEMQ